MASYYASLTKVLLCLLCLLCADYSHAFAVNTKLRGCVRGVKCTVGLHRFPLATRHFGDTTNGETVTENSKIVETKQVEESIETKDGFNILDFFSNVVNKGLYVYIGYLILDSIRLTWQASQSSGLTPT